jgi:hypothetical protein
MTEEPLPKFSELVKKFMNGRGPIEFTKTELAKITQELDYIFGKVFHKEYESEKERLKKERENKSN